MKIVSMTSPVMSSEAHWGKTETTQDVDQIIQYLQDPECFTADETFQDEDGNAYSIDDLIGVEVEVGNQKIKVNE
jgi:hypothetical protein